MTFFLVQEKSRKKEYLIGKTYWMKALEKENETCRCHYYKSLDLATGFYVDHVKEEVYNSTTVWSLSYKRNLVLKRLN